MHPSVAEMWRACLATLGETPETSARPLSSWHFCDNPLDADECADLALRGVKRATTASRWYCASRVVPRPRPGDLHLVTDWSGRARCVIRVLRVDVVPFGEVTEEYAAVEGEGDGSLAYWRRVHRAYYEREMAGTGIEVHDAFPVVCERFEVVYP